MKIDDLYPWNWFKHESAERHRTPIVPVDHESAKVRPISNLNEHLVNMRDEIDHMFGNVYPIFGGAALPSVRQHPQLHSAVSRPLADIAGDAMRYEIKLDVPGFAREDIALS